MARKTASNPPAAFSACTSVTRALRTMVQPLARQAVGGDPVMHHPARLRVGVADLDLVPEAPQVVGARQARRAGADHEDALAGRRARGDRPAFLDGAVAEEPIERMNRDGLVEEAAVAGAFTGVIAGAAVGGRQRVLLHVLPPGALVVTRLREVEPGLDVLAGRTGVIAWRQMIDVDGQLPSTRARALADGLLVDRRQILRNETHGCLHLAPHSFGRDTRPGGRPMQEISRTCRARQHGKSPTAQADPPKYRRSRSLRLLRQDVLEPTRHDDVVTRLHHPDADQQLVARAD